MLPGFAGAVAKDPEQENQVEGLVVYSFPKGGIPLKDDSQISMLEKFCIYKL